MSLITDYLKYLDRCLTPYHVVMETITILDEQGYKRISLQDLDSIGPGKYYVFAFNTVIIPIVIPVDPVGIRMVATHSDSPVLKLKPNFNDTVENMHIVRLRPYGGGLWHTWFDRSLSVGGLVMLKNGRRVLVDRMFDVIVPSLPPHLNNSKVYNNGFLYDKERVLNGLVMVDTKLDDKVFTGQGFDMNDKVGNRCDSGCGKCESNEANDRLIGSDSVLVEENSLHANSQPTCQDENILDTKNKSENDVHFKLEDVISHNLSLYDLAHAEVLNEQLIMSARQDNLLSTFAGLKALNTEGRSIKVLAVFDFEEIGSMQLDGARCTFLKDVYTRLQKNLVNPYDSMIISLDVAHTYNFNYDEFYEKKHRIKFNKGIVIKHSAAYATDMDGTAFIKQLSGFKCQDFCLRNDIRGGGTIGTMLSTLLGTRCIDLGSPIMAMHSIRETSSCKDVTDTFQLLYDFYKS